MLVSGGGYSMGGVGVRWGRFCPFLLIFSGEDDKTILVEMKHDWTHLIQDRNFILQGRP